ncbi:hypothetical protein [Mesobacillus maritimus]|uniref:hypothetical protein n=1 Tax=Mesobacillus maritimus TaxID=1643336 RepID=UPI00385137FE
MNLPSFLTLVLTSFFQLLSLVGSLIAVGFILGILERYANIYQTKAFGQKGVLLTAWIGTPIHEIGHLLMCFIWGHRVTRVKLLQLNPKNGVLGYVEHQYNQSSMYQQIGLFFIGLGPIFSGIGSLILGMYFLVPGLYAALNNYIFYELNFIEATVVEVVVEIFSIMAKSFFTVENFINPLFWLYIVLAICISSHIALSKADVEGASRGLIALFIALIIFNLVASFLGVDSQQLIAKIAQYNIYVLAFSSIALLFSLLTLLFSYLVYRWRIS